MSTVRAGFAAVMQPDDGYRYSVDALLLADFAASRQAGTCLELGTGSGVVAMTLLGRGACKQVVGVELQAELADCARQNATRLGAGQRFEILEADIRQLPEGLGQGSFDLVVFNPPFHHSGHGRPSPSPGRAVARHELCATLADFVRAGRQALGRRGRLCTVLPCHRLAELVLELKKVGLEPKRLRFVHPRRGAAAKLVLCEARAAKPGGLVVDAPLELEDTR